MSLESKTWKRIGLGAVTLLSTAVLAACGGKSSSTSSSDEINWYTPTEISTLDVSKVTDTYSSIAIGNSGSNLLRRNEDGELKPDLAEKVEVSEEAVREMVSRDVLESMERIRADFYIDPPLVRKVKEALGEPVLVSDCTSGPFPQKRVIIDVDRNTFERFWLNHMTEIKLLGPEFEINWLKQLVKMANESIEDAEIMKGLLGI